MSIQRLIDDVPSEEFFTALHYTKILKLLGLDCPAKTGGFVKCIKCKTASMLITGVAPFEAWFCCDRCKLAGEAIRLYGQAYKISNPQAIIAQIQEELKVKSLNAVDIALYCSFYDTYYNRIQLLWEKARANMYPRAADLAVGRLNELNLWSGQDTFNRGLINWFGYMPRWELEDLLQDSLTGIPKYAEGALVMPFYMKPGFICGFGLIGPKDLLLYHNMFTERACGFCGLGEATLRNADTTYIMAHPLQAARIHHKCTLERYNKIAVVAKGFVGELDCTALRGQSVVWQDDPDTAFFKTCVSIRGFKVLDVDAPYIWRPTEKVAKLWQNNLMPIIHKEIAKYKLQDPVDYLTADLLSQGLGKSKVTLEALNLTEFQKNLILAACPQEVRVEIAQLLTHSFTSQPIMMGGKILLERDGKLWIQGSREIPDEAVTNFLVRVTYICRNKHDGTGSIFGYIMVDDQQINFQVDEEALESSPKTVIATLLAAGVVPIQPYIAESIRKKFLDVVLRFSSPEVHAVQGYVGYDPETTRFNTPLMSIDPQQIRVGMPFVIAQEPVPAAEVSMMAGDTINCLTPLLAPGGEAAAYLAGLATVLANIYNNIEQGTRTNTLLVGAKGSLAEYVFDLLRIDLGLVTVALNSKKDLDEAKELAILHHLPVAIDGARSSPKLLSRWLEGQGGNSLVVTHALNAAAIGKDKDWSFIRADIPLTGESTALLNSEKMFPLLLQLMLTVRPLNSVALLDHINLLAQSLGVPVNSVALAKRFVSEKGYINTNAAGIHLINLIQEGIESGMFKTFTGPQPKRKPVVLKNPLDDTVTVDLTALLGQMRFFYLPIVDWVAAINHLKELGAVELTVDDQTKLVCPKPLWNSLVTATKRMKSMRTAFLKQAINLH